MCEGCGDLDHILHPDVSPTQAPVSGKLLELSQRWLGCLNRDETLVTLAAGLLIANLLTHSVVFSLALAGVSLLLLAAIGVNPLMIVKRLIVPSYLAAVAIVTQVLVTGQTPVFTFGPVVAHLEGLANGALIGSKIIAGAMIVHWLSAVMRMPSHLFPTESAFLNVPRGLVLATRLRLPSTLVEIGALMYRYLFVLGEEAERIRQAQVSRLGDRNWRTNVKSFGTLMGMIVVRSLDRAERVHEAMALRGNGEGLVAAVAPANKDLSGFLFGMPFLALLIWIGWTI